MDSPSQIKSCNGITFEKYVTLNTGIDLDFIDRLNPLNIQVKIKIKSGSICNLNLDHDFYSLSCDQIQVLALCIGIENSENITHHEILNFLGF